MALLLDLTIILYTPSSSLPPCPAEEAMPQDTQALLFICAQLESLLRDLQFALLPRPPQPPLYNASSKQTPSTLTPSLTAASKKNLPKWQNQHWPKSPKGKTPPTKSAQKTTRPSKPWQHGATKGRTPSNSKPEEPNSQWHTTSRGVSSKMLQNGWEN